MTLSSSWICVLMMLGLALAGVAIGGDTLPVAEPTASPDTKASESTGELRSISYDGLAVVRIADGTTYLFEHEPHTIRVTVSGVPSGAEVRVCLTARPTSDRADADELQDIEECTSDRTVEEDPEELQIDREAWPGDWTGEANTTFELLVIEDGNETVVDHVNRSVHVLDPDEDLSGSGLTNAEEFQYGTDFQRADTDHDGLTDGEEIHTYGTDPLTRDTAGNGVPDGIEVLIGTNPTNPYTPHVFVLGFAILIGLGFGGVAVYITTDRPYPEGDASTTSDEELSLMTDDEQVVRLLEDRGNRMKQQVIATEMEWSNSKVSRLLSQMEEDGKIERVRLGRENIITREAPDERRGN